MRKAVIIIPTFNESLNIKKTVEGITSSTNSLPNWDIEIVIVDSMSPDKTSDIIKKIQKQNKKIHLLETKKEGLGKAYVNGFHYALDHIHPFVIFEMDADLSHDPTDIPEFLKKIEKGADFVVGSRYIKGGSIPADWGIHRKIFSIFANNFVRFAFMKPQITDWTSGYRAIKSWIIKDALPHIKNYSGYVFQIALLDWAVKNNARVQETPIKFKDRKEGVSKINSAQYILHTFGYTFFHSSFVKYVMVGGIGFIIDSGILYSLYHFAHFGLNLSKIVSSETAILSNFLLNNFWAFSHKKLEHKLGVYIGKFIKFNLISLPSIIIQTIGIVLLSTLFGKHFFYPVFYNLIVIIFLVIPYSYFVYNKFIWKSR